jgi:hypothetical protein
MDGGRVRIMGRILKHFKSRAIEGKVRTVTVKRYSAGDFRVYLTAGREFWPEEAGSAAAPAQASV